MTTTRRTSLAPAAAALALALPAAAVAQSTTTPPPASTTPPPASDAAKPAAAPAPAEQSQGLLPVPNYSGSFTERSTVLGDLGGFRNDLAAKGLTFSMDYTQVAQGVVSGGRRIDWDYGGNLDTLLIADLMRMNVLPGALLRFRVESRYGETVNDDSGVILPVNSPGFFPLTERPNEGIPITITELNYTQFLCPQFGVTIGRFQTLDGDPNAFASGRGRTQFMNMNFLFAGATALVIPYATLGAGVIVLPNDHITITSMVMNTKDSSTTSGFDQIENGWTSSTQAEFQYKLGKLPGGMNFGFCYAWAGNFADLGGRLELKPGVGVRLPDQSTSWVFYWSGWQYLYTPDEAPAGKLDLSTGKPPLRGLGLFCRVGAADNNTNPVDWSISGGLGARGLIPGRDNDNCGIGYMYTDLETHHLRALALESNTQGFEAFYNLYLTPAIGLTFDAQWVSGAQQNINDATVLGCRLDIRF